MQISSRLSSRSIHVNQIQACRTLSNTRSIHPARSATISSVLMTIFTLKIQSSLLLRAKMTMLPRYFRQARAEYKGNLQKFKFPKRMIFTAADEKIYREATVCHICEQELGDDRVRDHCHLSGKFRGAAHESCNLNYKIPKFFPVVFHNLSGYDSHLFIKKLVWWKD
jgi:hypothetical protein